MKKIERIHCKNNEIFKLLAVKNLLIKVYQTSHQLHGRNVHLIKEENLMWQADSRYDVPVEKLIVNLHANDFTSEEDMDSNAVEALPGNEEH